MSTNAMSSANQGPEIFSSCPHVRKYFRALIHRANARERVKPQASPAALRPYSLATLWPITLVVLRPYSLATLQPITLAVLRP